MPVPFSFTVDKPEDLAATLTMVKTLVDEAGGVFDGTEHSGRIISNGTEGTYTVEADVIRITVEKKSKLLPEIVIREQIKSFFRRGGILPPADLQS